jgi:hypothetical protein
MVSGMDCGLAAIFNYLHLFITDLVITDSIITDLIITDLIITDLSMSIHKRP